MNGGSHFYVGPDRVQRVGLLLVLLPDAIMRWSLHNDGFPAGFGEWLVRRRRP